MDRPGTLFFACVIVLTLGLTACGGGGGGNDGTGSTADGGGDGTSTIPTGPAFDGFTFTLTEGSYWEFYWKYESSETTTSGTSRGFDAGNFRVSLGAPQTVGGLTAFPVTITGDHTDNADFDYAPRWHYLALQDSRLLGSTDGATFNTVFDAATGQWSGGGFFVPFPDDAPVQATVSAVSNDFIDTNAIKVSRSASQSQCSYYPEAGTICTGDASYTLSESEYHKGGIGPIAYSYHYSYADPSGTYSMSAYRDLGLVATSFTATDGFQPKQPWVQKAAMPTGRSSHCAAVVGDDIYVIGGTDGTAGNAAATSVDVYSTVNDSWSAGPSLPAPRVAPACTTVAGKVYVTGGNDGTGGVATVYELDPATATWTTLADLSVARSGHNAVEVDGAVLVMGGGSKVSTEFFYPGSAPQPGANLPESMNNSAAAAEGTGLDRRVYIFGHYCSGCIPYTYLSICHKLDPFTWTWSSCAAPGGRAFLSAATINSTVYAVGGRNAIGTLSELVAYDPILNTWTQKARMLHPRSNSAAAVVNGRLYVFGGLGSSGVGTSVEEYDPARDL